MKLQTVSAQNLKGESFTISLGEMTMIIGGNFRRKTARLDAIQLALLGYIPALGKTNAATFGLCSGKELIIEATFTDGTTLRRRWWLKGDSVKAESILPPGFDDSRELIAVMLDPDQYFGLSTSARTDFVFANIPGLGAEYTPALILQSAFMDIYAHETKDGGSLDPALVEQLQERTEKELRELERKPSFAGWTPQSYVAALLETMEGFKKRAKEQASVMEKGVQALAHLRAQDELNGPDITALDATHRQLTDELTALREERARVNAVIEQARTMKRRREEILFELKQKPSLLASVEARQLKADEFKKKLAELAIVPQREFDNAVVEEAGLAAALRDTNRQLAEVAEAIEKNKREKADVDKQALCPFCGASGDGWKGPRCNAIDSTISALVVKQKQLHEQREKQSASHALLAGRNIAERHARAQRSGAEADEKANAAALAGAQRSLDALNEREKKLADYPDTVTSLDELDALTGKIDRKQGEVNDVDGKRRALLGRASELKRLAAAEEQRDEAKKDEEVAKAAVAIVQDQRMRMVEDAFRPLLETANSFFPDILKNSLAFFEGEVGWWDDGRWVAHKTFSGTERALAYAAIQAALAAKAPGRLMLIDELGRLDDANAIKFAHDVALAIVRGDLAQFVGVDTGRAATYEGNAPSDLPLTILQLQ